MIFQQGDPPPFYAPHLKPEEYEGKPKGIRQVLWERGLLTPNITLDGKKVGPPGREVPEVGTSARHRLSTCPDFLHQKSALQLAIEEKHHLCEFLPKYHPEMNPIENCWGWVKRAMRKECKYTYEGMLKNLPKTMVRLMEQKETVWAYFRGARNYLVAYLKGATAATADGIIKVYKSHRRPASSLLDPGKITYEAYGKKKAALDDGSGTVPTRGLLKPTMSKKRLDELKKEGKIPKPADDSHPPLLAIPPPEHPQARERREKEEEDRRIVAAEQRRVAEEERRVVETVDAFFMEEAAKEGEGGGDLGEEEEQEEDPDDEYDLEEVW